MASRCGSAIASGLDRATRVLLLDVLAGAAAEAVPAGAAEELIGPRAAAQAVVARAAAEDVGARGADQQVAVGVAAEDVGAGAARDAVAAARCRGCCRGRRRRSGRRRRLPPERMSRTPPPAARSLPALAEGEVEGGAAGDVAVVAVAQQRPRPRCRCRSPGTWPCRTPRRRREVDLVGARAHRGVDLDDLRAGDGLDLLAVDAWVAVGTAADRARSLFLPPVIARTPSLEADRDLRGRRRGQRRPAPPGRGTLASMARAVLIGSGTRRRARKSLLG